MNTFIQMNKENLKKVCLLIGVNNIQSSSLDYCYIYFKNTFGVVSHIKESEYLLKINGILLVVSEMFFKNELFSNINNLKISTDNFTQK